MICIVLCFYIPSHFNAIYNVYGRLDGQGMGFPSLWTFFSYYTAATAIIGPKVRRIARANCIRGESSFEDPFYLSWYIQFGVVLAEECVNEGKMSLNNRKSFS